MARGQVISAQVARGWMAKKESAHSMGAQRTPGQRLTGQDPPVWQKGQEAEIER